MSKNFSLAEMVASDTARRNGIDNTPSLEVVSHLDEFCDNLLLPLTMALLLVLASIQIRGEKCSRVLRKGMEGKELHDAMGTYQGWMNYGNTKNLKYKLNNIGNGKVFK